VVAWTSAVGEVWWKRTDYVWVFIGTLALLGSGLHKIRAIHYADGAQVHREKVAAARGRILSFLDREIAEPYVPLSRYVTGPDRAPRVVDPTPDERAAHKDRHEKRQAWLQGVRAELSQKGPDWTATDLATAKASPPTDARGQPVTAPGLDQLAEVLTETEQSEMSYLTAKDMSPDEVQWLFVSPIALTLAIGLRLGKTSAEVRKLRPATKASGRLNGKSVRFPEESVADGVEALTALVESCRVKGEGTDADRKKAREGDHVRVVFARPVTVAVLGEKLKVSELVFTQPPDAGVFWLLVGDKVIHCAECEHGKESGGRFLSWRDEAAAAD
jgi:hypothetical protein